MRLTGVANDADFEIVVFWRRQRYRWRYPTDIRSIRSRRQTFI